MVTQELTEQIMALPLEQRVGLAEALWQSIGQGLQSGGEHEAIEQAARRDADLTSGAALARTHEEVMQAARRAIGRVAHRRQTPPASMPLR